MQIGSSFATPSIVHHELYPAIGFDATVINNKQQRGQELLHGSFAHDGTIAWICSKNYLQIFNLSIFKRTHLISFKNDDDELMEINTAAEVHIQHRKHLLVSARTTNTHTHSTLYLIDARTGSVVTQVQFNHVITALLVLHGTVPPHFTQPLLLGTLGGHVLLTDLARHVPHARMQVHHVPAAEYDGTKPPNTLPVVVVNASHVTGEHVQYPTTRDQVTLLKRSNVSVTALVESLHGVLVGFNFGCVQLWSLASFTCHLASDLHEQIKSATSTEQYTKPPVTALAVQRLGTEEWLWVTRGSCHTSTCHHESSSNIALYHLSRDQDTRLECEFQRVLVGSTNKYSHVIGMQTLDQGSDRPQVMFVWETLPLRDFEWQITRHVELFDWQSTGLAQPALFKSYPLKIDAPQSRDQLSGLACWVNPMTVRDFHRHVTLDHVSDSHGVALSCALHVLTPRAVSILSYQSHAEQLLTKIAQRGAGGLTNFGQFYTWACDQGLCARSEDEVTRLMNYWDMLLEYNLVAVLADYITHRSMDHEYTLTNTKIIFDWLSRAYAKLVARIDQNAVTALKSPLHTDDKSHDRQHEDMSRWFVLIIDLLALLQSLASRRDISAEHTELLNDKSRDMFSTSQTLEIVLWCVSHALVDPSVRTPLVNLDGQIKQRRKDRQQRHYRHFWTIKNMTRVNLPTEQQSDHGDGTKLFIDLLWDSMTATSSAESDHVSSYPPSSLSALVEVFQRTHADLIVKKRCVLLYLLYDLQLSAALIEDCAQSFMIDQDYQLLTRALWLLDTQQFTEAVALLTGGTRHGAKIELEQWTRLIVKTLHDYEQYALALRVITANNYLQSHLLIGHQSRDQITGTDDVITYIDVLLYNNLLHQAFNAVRAISRTTREGSYDAVLLETLLYHLFHYCHAHNKLDVLFELPLDALEDQYLVQFLQRSSQARDAQYLLVYYLQRGRVSEAVQCHHELLKKHVTDPNQSALVENYLLTLPAVQRRALTAVTVAPVKAPATLPETPKSAVKRHVPRLFNTPSDSATASPSTFKRPSHVSHVTAGSVNSPIRPRKSLALLAPTAVRLTGGPRMSLTGVKSSRMSLGGPSRRQSLIGLLTAPADTPVTPVTSNYGVKAAEESPRDSELKQRTPFKQVRPQSPPQSPLQHASTTLQQTLRRMEDVKPTPAAVVLDLDSDDESEHVTPVAKNNNTFTKLSSESSLFSESSAHSDEDDVDMHEDHVSDHVSDEELSDESDHVIDDAPIEELSSDEDDVSSKVSAHVIEAEEIDRDEQHFDDNQAWINNYVPRATTSVVQDTVSRDIPDDTEHISEVPVSDMEDIPPVTSTFDFVDQFPGPAATEDHVPESVNMSVDQGEEHSVSQSRASKVSSPHHSREEQSASVPADEESAEEASVNDSVNLSVNQSLISREDKSDSVNQSVNQSLASHDEHSDEEPRTRESLGGSIRRSSRLQQTPKPQYNFQKLSKRKASKKEEGAEPVASETPAKLRRAAARVNDPLTKAKTKRMTKRK